MATDNLFNKSADEIIKGSNTINITQKTVRFGSDVYQFKNITGFGMTVIKKPPIPLEVVIGTAIVGFFLLINGMNFGSSSSALWGLGLIVFALMMIGFNQSPNKIYGLKLYLPSGENKVFLSNDVHGIHDIIAPGQPHLIWYKMYLTKRLT